MLHGKVLNLFPQIRSFDQTYKFIATGDAIIHVPNSPDSLDHRSMAYFFQGEALKKQVRLDILLLENFRKKFGEEIVLYRTMGAGEVELYRQSDYLNLRKKMKTHFKSDRKSYNASRPTLHFSVEKPISWTTKDDHVARFEILVTDLIKAVESQDAQVGLYGSMLEVQISSNGVEVLKSKPYWVAPADFENLRATEIENLLREVDNSAD